MALRTGTRGPAQDKEHSTTDSQMLADCSDIPDARDLEIQQLQQRLREVIDFSTRQEDELNDVMRRWQDEQESWKRESLSLVCHHI